MKQITIKLMTAYILLGLITLSCSDKNETISVEVLTEVPDEISQYDMVEISFQTNAEFNDPYSSSDIRLDGNIEGPNGNKIVPAFFVERSEDGNSIWKLRFTPRLPGDYKIVSNLKSSHGSATSSEVYFTSVTSDKKGFLQLPENGSQYYLEFDSGEKFRGVGTNYAWEDQPWDGETPFYYPDYFKTLNDAGANIIRKWMNPWSLPLIWTQPDNENLYSDEVEYKFNRSAIERTDLMFKEALSNDIYIILVLDYHGNLQTEPDYWGGNNYWKNHPDNKLNGGTAESPAEFFTNESAIENYKDRLRFIIARWGAFTNLATIELWNEVDNAVENEGIPESSIVEWHDEIGAYLKKINPYPHLVSTSVSHRHIPDLFAAKGIDYTHIHIYGNTAGIPSVMDSVRTLYQKPVVVGEVGYDWRRPEPDQVAEFNKDLFNSYWNTLLEPTPIYPMPWWWEFFYEETDNEAMKSIAVFNEILMASDWDDFVALEQQNYEGIEVELLYGGNTYVGLLESSLSSKEPRINIQTKHNFSDKFNVLFYDTDKGIIISEETLSISEDSMLTVPDKILTGSQKIALIMQSM